MGLMKLSVGEFDLWQKSARREKICPFFAFFFYYEGWMKTGSEIGSGMEF